MTMGALALPVVENPAHPLRKKLWLASGALTVFVLTIVIGNSLIDRRNAITADAVGHDFLAFYTAGHFLREGQASRMYDLEAVRQFQQEIGQANHLELKKQSFGPFWNPPFYAWLFAPLAGLPFRTALVIWWGINLLCLAGAMVLMCRMLTESPDWRIVGLVPAILLNSLPFHQALNHGQSTFTSLFILSGTVWFWRRAAEGRGAWDALWAGLVCGLVFYKPQLGAAVAIVLVLHLGWRAMLGVAITSSVLLLVTVIAMPGMLQVYLAKMPGNLAWMQEINSYLWERHVTLKAFWRLMLQGHATGGTSGLVKLMWVVSAGIVGGGLAGVVWRQMDLARIFGFKNKALTLPSPGVAGEGQEREEEHGRGAHATQKGSAASRLIAATFVAMPLLMPFYFDYDLLLLSIAAVLFAAEIVAQRREMTNEESWLVRAWVVLFVVMFFNASISGMIRVHLAVISLSVVALLHIRRAWGIDRVAA